ncbi:MAG: hypothetical protein J6J17_05205 [Bacilli bacterium]|nr:hypothetical protein [Bacilli bacterium]
MNINLDELYEERKRDLTYEIDFIEGVQYNFKLEDMEKLLGINSKEDLENFKKYLFYLDVFRVNFLLTDSLDDEIDKFESILDEDERIKEKLIEIYIKHQNLFRDESGIRKLNLVPKIYDCRIFAV